MKTVAGKVLSTIPISLSKATSILSKFVSADTGASQAVCAYLRRASVSFNELNQLHKELKSYRKHKTHKSETITEDEMPNPSVISDQQLLSHSGFSREHSRVVSNGVENEGKKRKKKKKRKSEDIEGTEMNSEESRSEKKKKKKRRKSVLK